MNRREDRYVNINRYSYYSLAGFINAKLANKILLWIMFLLKIARLGHPVIRNGAEPVSQEELKTPSLQNLIDSMIQTMRDADGVGIAAPQVHVPKRMIIIEVSPENPRYPQQEAIPLTVIVNPKITFKAETYEEGWEGCLSVPNFRAKVPRSTAVRVSGLDRQGDFLEIDAKGFFARVIQHEVDHLEGKVFLDRLPNLQTLTYLREYQKYWQTETHD
jgi:peptide deformylase